MTPPKSTPDDDSEALYWLKMAKRVISGEIDPDNARAVLSARRKERAKPRVVKRTAPAQH